MLNDNNFTIFGWYCAILYLVQFRLIFDRQRIVFALVYPQLHTFVVVVYDRT
jgi:hypothetical protein